MAGFFTSQLASWSFNKKVNDFKKEVDNTFGGNNNTITLDHEPDVTYNRDEHASYSAQRAAAANKAGKSNVKSDAVKAAMERRAAAQQAAAEKARGRR
mmetsp:Transcript_19933/g.60244  ORF Transcript_19933/g.60244 Transcript_19933/m.60244 type:complete len:98 (+) Transcript_19933:293-586(+)